MEAGEHLLTEKITIPDHPVYVLGSGAEQTIVRYRPNYDNRNTPAFYCYGASNLYFVATGFTLAYDSSEHNESPSYGRNGFSLKHSGGTKKMRLILQNLVIRPYDLSNSKDQWHSGVYWEGGTYNHTSVFIFNVLAWKCSYAGFYGGALHGLLAFVAAAQCLMGFYFSNAAFNVVNNFLSIDCTTGAKIYSNFGASYYQPSSLFTNGYIVRPTTAIELVTHASGPCRLHAPRVTNVVVNNCSGKLVALWGYNSGGYISDIVLENIIHTTGSEDGTSQVTPDYGLHVGATDGITFRKVTGCDFSDATTPVYLASGHNSNWENLDWKEVKI
ncbi:MAG: hypothetical protein DRP82_02385 [Planctomycetota bacterium]|nr:MAG: hypothetical protein DRP82_02385 [Planctomycetota bacterium]